jgi:hypothetical protein
MFICLPSPSLFLSLSLFRVVLLQISESLFLAMSAAQDAVPSGALLEATWVSYRVSVEIADSCGQAVNRLEPNVVQIPKVACRLLVQGMSLLASRTNIEMLNSPQINSIRKRRVGCCEGGTNFSPFLTKRRLQSPSYEAHPELQEGRFLCGCSTWVSLRDENGYTLEVRRQG